MNVAYSRNHTELQSTDPQKEGLTLHQISKEMFISGFSLKCSIQIFVCLKHNQCTATSVPQFFFNFCSFIFFWLCQVFVAESRLSLVAAPVMLQRSFSLQWLLLLQSTGFRARTSVVAAHGLSCFTACRILVPRPGIKLMSPALAGRFSTTGPPGKSPFSLKLKYG